MNIMVVIYNSLLRLPIVKHLTGSSNSIIAVTDKNSALNKLTEGGTACIILDLNLPTLVNGLDLLKKIKIKYPDIPIIIININLDEKIINTLVKTGLKNILNIFSIKILLPYVKLQIHYFPGF